MTQRLDKKPRDAAAEQRVRRDNKRAKGFVQKQIWVDPKDWEMIQAAIKRITNKG